MSDWVTMRPMFAHLTADPPSRGKRPAARDAAPPVAVVGAGFSGTLVALHLLDRLPPGRRVLLCERAPTFGQGAAYATREPSDLLNVRASNMSAFPDRPGHFEEWLKALDGGSRGNVRWTEAGTFVPRGLYGEYLASLLRQAVARDAAARLGLIHDRVVDLEPAAGGYRLRLDGGRAHEVSGAVLAVGNLRAESPGTGTYRSEPWRSEVLAGLDPNRPVLILGTGLTMIDLAVRLGRQGFPGRVIALSRRGLLPHAHERASVWPAPDIGEEDRRSAAKLVRFLRREAERAEEAGQDWRGVVDSLRPLTAWLWRELPLREQERVLRHARPWWDIHRHRMAPPVADDIARLLAEGRLEVRAGRVQGMDVEDGQATVRFRPRGASAVETIVAQRVIDATGPVGARQAGDPLIAKLLDRGLVRPDAHGLGIDVTDRLEAVGATGKASRGLWALGPVVRGVFWECTAVPDIRLQAVKVASTAAASLGEVSVRSEAGLG